MENNFIFNQAYYDNNDRNPSGRGKVPSRSDSNAYLHQLQAGNQRTHHGEETTIDNIDLADIKKYVSKEQYQRLLSIGTKFPPEVAEFFALVPKKEDA